MAMNRTLLSGKSIAFIVIAVILIAAIVVGIIFFYQLRVLVVGTGYKLFVKTVPENVCMIGHRGYSSMYQENTDRAFIEAAKHGSGGVETDVRVTSDGKLVLSHGGTVEFADGTSLEVAKATFEELTSKPIKNEHSDEILYLCTFERYLNICKEYDLIAFIELKSEWTDKQIYDAFSMASEIYDLSKCSLQSFSMDNLLRTRRLCPELPLMLTYGWSQMKEKFDYTQCFEYGIDIDMDRLCATKKIIDEFHSHGLKVGIWTCNTEAELNYSYYLGADYIESDVF